MNKTIYHYHPVTREYIGQGEADESPLEPGAPLIPAHATPNAPLPTGGRDAAVFDPATDDWIVLPDFRAVDLYSIIDGSRVAVTDLGQQPPDTTDKPRPSPLHDWNGSDWKPNYAKIKAAKWDAIKVERDRRNEQGGFKVGTNWFHSDQRSRSQQLGLALLGASIPAGLQWKTMDGTFVTMTQQLAGQVLAVAAASDQAIFASAEVHKAAMEASQDPAAYDFSDGWPAIYGE